MQIIRFRGAITHINIEEKIYPFKATSHNAPTMTEPLLGGLHKYCLRLQGQCFTRNASAAKFVTKHELIDMEIFCTKYQQKK